MATFYFNAAVNNDWATLGNWWMNSSYTIAATALPTASDDVIIDGFLSENTGNAITVYNLTANYPVSEAMTVTGVATFNVELFSGPITGNCIFNNNSINWTVINGDCIFNDSAVNDYDAIITGNCVFNDYSRNDGTIYGDCIFNNSSFNSNIINGDCVFNNSSRNESIYGAYNPAYMAQIIGNASFYDDSFNYGLVSGSVIYDGFTGTNSFGSFVNGQILSRTFYFNAAVSTDLATLGNWWMNSSYTIAATALPTVFDDAIINGNVGWNSGSDITLSNLTANYDFLFFSSFSGALTVTGVATFNDNANVGEGNINGNCIFNNNSNNNAFITGNCTFNDDSYNNFGTINGNCTFNDSSYNDGTITGNCTFHGDARNQSGTITGNCVFNDNAFCGIMGMGMVWGDCEFNGNAQHYGDIIGDCIFNGTCGVNTTAAVATVEGNCTFNDSSYNNGTITGDCTFNDGSYNVENITGDCTFNDSSYNINSNNPASIKNGTITGDCIFNHTSYNAGFVIGYATFNDYSYNRIEWLPGYSASVKRGAVFKSAVFNDYSANEGEVNWGATFNHNSRNGSAIFWAGVGGGGTIPIGEELPRPAEEVATFNDSSYVLAGSIYMDCFFNHSSYYNPEYYPTLYYPPVFQNRTPYPIPRGINGSSILGVV